MVVELPIVARQRPEARVALLLLERERLKTAVAMAAATPATAIAPAAAALRGRKVMEEMAQLPASLVLTQEVRGVAVLAAVARERLGKMVLRL